MTKIKAGEIKTDHIKCKLKLDFDRVEAEALTTKGKDILELAASVYGKDTEQFAVIRKYLVDATIELVSEVVKAGATIEREGK